VRKGAHLVAEAKAVVKYVRIAPSKVRIVVDLVRGKALDEALAILRFTSKRASRVVEKVIRSAAANAENNYNMKRRDLMVSEVYVDQGPTMKRWHPRQRGRAFPILKKTSHVTVVLRDGKEA
jgi:large subunit ribosomal protein L22